MGDIVHINKKRPARKSIVIDNKTYVYLPEFAERVGLTCNTIYQWRYEGKLSRIAMTYNGRLVFEEKAIEPFKKTLLGSVAVFR